MKDRSFEKTLVFSFQALLDLYLLENIEETYKHAIVSFLVIFITPSVDAHEWSSMFVTYVFKNTF